ncbi:MAG TPA: nicotinate (nicotinamide) nucleotide adenylyltransferase [Candidatus Ozemobacteraceae bacterium]|nr:nicotinate (nicotinamide) nucleotide adenylyltransferase [Candidatus Ozemobacteraceae bacterium]
MKIGLFGGSFNPVHRHHVKIAEAVRDVCGLDEVWFVPVHQPVHKLCLELLPYQDRRVMLETAIRRLPGLRICDIERDIGGPSYTIRTVRRLRETFPENEFLLIIGADSLRDLPGWKAYEDLVRETRFAVVVRPGIGDQQPLPNPRSIWVPLEADPASSSGIRAAISRGRMKGLPVQPGVMALIVEAGHYGCWSGPFSFWREELQKQVSNLVPGLRGHIESVAKLAAEYACELGLDARLGLLAGLAHDLYRAADPAKIRAMTGEAGIRLSSVERSIPMLAHGAAAAAYLSTLDPVPPLCLRRAVRWHTFPRQAHAPLTRALIMADALDPSRAEPERNRLRESDEPVEMRWKKVISLKRVCADRAENGRQMGVCRAEPAAGSPVSA